MAVNRPPGLLLIEVPLAPGFAGLIEATSNLPVRFSGLLRRAHPAGCNGSGYGGDAHHQKPTMIEHQSHKFYFLPASFPTASRRDR